MVTTEGQLVEQLKRLGHDMTKRCLTDWRANGILPALASKGQGKGRGKSYFWSQPDILRNAVTVCELLEWHGRMERIILPLWLLGYTAPLDTVRKKLMEWHEANIEPLVLQLGSEDSLEEAVDFVTRLDLGWPQGSDMPDLEGKQHRISFATENIARAVLKAISRPSYKLSGKDTEEAMQEIAGARDHLRDHGQSSAYQAFFDEHPDRLRSCVDFLRRCRLSQAEQLLSGASDEELLTCQSDLRLLCNFLRNAAHAMSGLASLRSKWIEILLAFAPYALIVDLWARRNGDAWFVNHLMRGLMDVGQKALGDDLMRLRADGNRDGSVEMTE